MVLAASPVKTLQKPIPIFSNRVCWKTWMCREFIFSVCYKHCCCLPSKVILYHNPVFRLKERPQKKIERPPCSVSKSSSRASATGPVSSAWVQVLRLGAVRSSPVFHVLAAAVGCLKKIRKNKIEAVKKDHWIPLVKICQNPIRKIKNKKTL